MKKLQPPKHQRLRTGYGGKPQQLQWARYRHFLHDRYDNPVPHSPADARRCNVFATS